MKKNKLRIAAVGDIHVHEHGQGTYREFFKTISDRADILLLAGDLTDRGRPEEAQVLVEEAKECTVPIVAVLGNHDCESGKEREMTEILRENNIHLLDGEAFVYEGVGIAGVRGFGGGFGRYMLSSWGEKIVKDFVYETVNEVLKLEKAMSEIADKRKVILLHYAPVRQTVEGEPPEIFPFLGSSRLEESINRVGAAVIFHGHAHHGTVEGKTATGIPVLNVARPLLKEKKGVDAFVFEV